MGLRPGRTMSAGGRTTNRLAEVPPREDARHERTEEKWPAAAGTADLQLMNPKAAATPAPAALPSYSEVVEAEGHLIDSQILNVVFDTVVRRNASFDVLKFSIGRSND